jgi:hypothetical protein
MAPLSHRRLERVWILGNVGYAVFRILLARQFLSSRGLNIWGFAIVEGASSIPWAIGSARLVRSIVDRRTGAALRWAAVATAGFFAPDVYIVATTHQVPWWIYAVLATWVTIATTVATRRLLVAIRARRLAAGELRTPGASPPSRH